MCVSFSWAVYSLSQVSNFGEIPKSCLVLCSYCGNLLYSPVKCPIISSLSPQNLHLLFCCILSNFALTSFDLMALFCTAIRRDSGFSLQVSLRHVPVLWEILLMFRLKDPYTCFSSHFCFLVTIVLLILLLFVLFLVALISSYFFVSMKSSSRLMDTSTLSKMPTGLLTYSFLNTYNLSVLSLGYKPLYTRTVSDESFSL